jgi:copper chaperone CopZ
MKALLISTALMFGILMASPVQSHAQDAQKDKAECTVKGDLAEATFKVDGVCSMCKDRIETAAKEVKGVKKANWNKETKKATVHFKEEKVEKKAIQKAIAKAGHDTEKMKASDEAYAALPQCCKYRSE